MSKVAGKGAVGQNSGEEGGGRRRPIIAVPGVTGVWRSLSPENKALRETLVQKAISLTRGLLRFSLTEEIWMMGVDAQGEIVGVFRVARGGVGPGEIDLRRVIAHADHMDAAGVVLVQSHPGPIDERPEIDPLMSIHAAFSCEDVGVLLLDHVFINAQGHSLSLREHGYFDEVRSMVGTIRDVAVEIVEEQGIPGYGGEPKPPVPEQRWVWGRRR